MREFSAKTKRLIIIVSAALLMTTLSLFFAGCASPQVAVNEIMPPSAELCEEAFEYMNIFASEGYADRTMGGEGEFAFANFLSQKMIDWGYIGEYSHEQIQGLQRFQTTFKRYSGEEVKEASAYNVVFSKKTGAQESKGEILLCCQYDNLYSEAVGADGKIWGADGSYESGSGVAVLLTLARRLKDIDSDYDLKFVFFTGGSYCWKGAMQYVSYLDRNALNKIALVLNYAMPVGGENWYIYSGENSTSYGRYLNLCGGGNATAVPKDRNIAQFILSDDAIFNYINVGMMSNQYFFMNKGVATASFTSLNWEVNEDPLFTEIAGKSNVYHTPDDTLATMIERKGEEKIKAQLSEVIATTLSALDADNASLLDSYLEVAAEQRPDTAAQDSGNASLINVVFKAVLIGVVFALSYAIKSYVYRNRSKYLPPKEPVKKEEPFESDGAGAEDFGEKISDDGEKEQESTDFDDPFA